MDKRYIELIADNFPYELPKHYKRIVNICFIAAIAGALLLFTHKEYVIYAFAAGLLGGIGMIAVGIKTMLFRKKQAKEFISNYESTGKLPAWPEGKEKIASPQFNN